MALSASDLKAPCLGCYKKVEHEDRVWGEFCAACVVGMSRQAKRARLRQWRRLLRGLVKSGKLAATVLLCLVVSGCADWSWEPYVEVSSRHERIGDTPYEGETLTAGARLRRRAPERERPWRLPEREPAPVRTHVPEPVPEPEKTEKSYEKEILAARGLPWYAWFGLTAVILAASVFVWMWRRGKKVPGGDSA